MPSELSTHAHDASFAPLVEGAEGAEGAEGIGRGAAESERTAAGTLGDRAYQDAILPRVSRTFALTIPELPEDLRDVVANGYLLCRIADTIEDEATLAPHEKRRFHEMFAAAVAGEVDAQAFADELAPRLSAGTLDAERELVSGAARVVRIAHRFEPRKRRALARCVRVMCGGMARFAEKDRAGLADVGELHDYCYFVAGVVGEMLTELFCSHDAAIAARREGLERLAVSFGHALQMTNILKDVWDDLDRGACWLPRDLLAEAGIDVERFSPDCDRAALARCLEQLIAIAHGHLRDSLEYTLLIPAREPGIRRFCLWALGMAVLTLRKIHRRLDFRRSREVKITRRSVRATILASNLVLRSDLALRLLFAAVARGLPLASVERYRGPARASSTS